MTNDADDIAAITTVHPILAQKWFENKELQHGCSTCVANVRKRYASLLPTFPPILEEWKH